MSDQSRCARNGLIEDLGHGPTDSDHSATRFHVPVDASDDQTEAGNAETRIAIGVSVLRTLRSWACARKSMGPEQIGGIAIDPEVWRTEARKLTPQAQV